MGGSSWSSTTYNSLQHHRSVSGVSAFLYNDDILAGMPYHQRSVHEEMDPKKFKNGIRESRDSDAHPNSKAIAVFFDETGSMGGTPRILQKKLGQLMSLLVEKGYVTDPQIMFGAVGDAYSDNAPIQAGQFESGIEMDSDLGKLYLEGMGGGQEHESYGLVHYLIGNHTSIDCYEKRGEKGYLFTIGDENPYEKISKNHIKEHIGDNLETDISLAEAIEKTKEKYNVFHIIPNEPGASTYVGRDDIKKHWNKYLGENVLLLDTTEAICETIALTIGLLEGTIDLEDGMEHLKQLGVDDRIVRSASQAVATLKVDSKAVVTGTLPTGTTEVGVQEL